MTEGIIVRHPKVSLTEYEGEYSYLGTTLRQANIEPQPSLSDVRRLVTQFAILPLGEYSAITMFFCVIECGWNEREALWPPVNNGQTSIK